MADTDYNPAQTIIDNMHSAVIVIGENLQVKCLNPAAEMLFYISNSRAVNKSIRSLVSEEHEFFDRLERSLISAHPYTVYDDLLRLHNHSTIDVDYSVSPIQYSNDGHYLLLEFIRLKARHKITQEENLIQQYEATKTLLRGLAHEIKNPLGGIRGSAQLLERELDDNDHKQYTQIIINEADRLKNLLDRMVGPKDIPTKSNVNIHQVLEHVRKLVLAENNQVSISADYDPSIPELHADESMLIQVILNITRNAVHALSKLNNVTPEDASLNDADGKIIFKTRTRRNCKIGAKTFPLATQVDIEDNGYGVSESLKETIFMPMITGHAEGTGLGLSIAQSLAQQHEGLIEFSSKPGKTIFTLLLPITDHRQSGTKHDERIHHRLKNGF